MTYLNKMKLLLGFAFCYGIAGPAHATECIAPANVGGSWDFACRVFAVIGNELETVNQPIEIINMSGEKGGSAYSHVVNERNADEELIVAASSETVFHLAHKAYGDYTADQVRFLGAIGANPGVIVVAKDSPYNSLENLIEEVKNNPESITFVGSSEKGGMDHRRVLTMLHENGFNDSQSVQYVSKNGGRNAILESIEDHSYVMTGNISEVADILKLGYVRALAVFSEEPILGLEEIPTAKEQGINIIEENWLGFYLPKEISDETYDNWTNILEQVADSSEWAEIMKAKNLVPFKIFGDDFQSYIDREIQETKKIVLF